MSLAASSDVRRDWLWGTILTVAAGWLFLGNLGDQRLWQDEAQTAVIAKTVLSDGVPRGYDGNNFFSQERGREYGRNYVYRWHPWFPFYLLAGVFGLCGINEWTARLPFALMGWATVPLCYWFARSLWQSRRAAVLAAVLVATCVPFLVLSRQCRYYSPCVLFSLLGLIAYYHLVRRRRGAAALFVASAILLFHSLFLYWAVLIVVVLIHAAIFHRDRLAATALWSGITLLLNLPWLVWLLSPPTVGRYPERMDRWYTPLAVGAKYLIQTFQYVFSPVLVLLAVLMAGVSKTRAKRLIALDPTTVNSGSLIVLFVAVTYGSLCVATPLHFFRYLTPAIPLLCVLAAKILDSAMRLHWSLGIVGLAVALGTSPLPDYLYEITHHFVGPVDGLVSYLNEHGKPDDVVAITYDDMPLKFYTQMRVVGGLTGEDLAPALTADWVIFRYDTHCDKDEAVKDFLAKNLPWQQYRKIVLDYPDTPSHNREDPEGHYYRTVIDAPRLVIFQKKATKEAF
jgi:4-amino-4-deoxy-L-arabinose transferase-like glycosyltransferase